MRKATNDDIANIQVFLKKNIADCLYMYIDIVQYGVDNANIEIWIDDSNGSISAVAMRYYDSLQIYLDDFEKNVNWVSEEIKQNEYSMVSGPKMVIEILEEKLKDTYDSEYGDVYQITSYRLFDSNGLVEHATCNDMKEVAKLICSDPAFEQNYKVDILERQLKDRLKSGMGRNIIIKECGQIVAHIATYAECENITITSGLIVRNDCRKKLYGLMIESYLVNELLAENKMVYTFILDKRRAELLNAIGAHRCSEYGKLTKRTTN